MLKRLSQSVFLLILLSQPNLPGKGTNIDKRFLGEWTAYSNTHMNFLGELEITEGRLNFSKAGSCAYKIVKRTEDRLLVKLDREIHGSTYAGIGPLRKSNSQVADYPFMDFSLFKNKENGLVAISKSDPLEKCSLWGVYIPRRYVSKPDLDE